MSELPRDNALYRVEQKAEELARIENQFEQGYAHLGWLLLEVAQMQYWRVYYNSFRDYLNKVAGIAKKTPAQLQRYFLTVRDLVDDFTIHQLEQIGITKAMMIRNAKDYAIILPSAITVAALDPKVSAKDLKKVISTSLKMPEEEGDWMDLECEFMVTPEQRATIEQAVEVAMHTEPITKSTISRSAQMLDVMMKFSQEFLGGHSGDGN